MKPIIDLLCQAFSKELKAYHGYLHAYVTVTGPLESVYGAIYEKFMQRELHHLEELGKKIVVMGGSPPTDYPPITAVAEAVCQGYEKTLSVLQEAEIETLEMYKEIHAAADKDGDLPLVLLIEEIIQEEEEHHDELERILLGVPSCQAEFPISKKDAAELKYRSIDNKQAAKIFRELRIKQLNKLCSGD